MSDCEKEITVSKVVFARAVVLHRRWLEHPGTGERIDFTGYDLRGHILAGMDLRHASFAGAVLDGVDLRVADFEGANFAGASMKGADLSGAVLRDASLAGAELQFALVRGAVLDGTRMTFANCTGLVGIGADFRDALLDGANLTDANFTDAILERTNLIGAKLAGADFSGVDISRAVVKNSEVVHHSEIPFQFRGHDQIEAQGVEALHLAMERWTPITWANPMGPQGEGPIEKDEWAAIVGRLDDAAKEALRTAMRLAEHHRCHLSDAMIFAAVATTSIGSETHRFFAERSPETTALAEHLATFVSRREFVEPDIRVGEFRWNVTMGAQSALRLAVEQAQRDCVDRITPDRLAHGALNVPQWWHRGASDGAQGLLYDFDVLVSHVGFMARLEERWKTDTTLAQSATGRGR